MPISVPIYTMQGVIVGERELDPAIFGIPMRTGLLHQVIVGILANERAVVAHTKGRGEVRGGGKKPWAQKGTGRARHGSIRSPIWKGGGVTFGPTNERNFKQKINKKVRAKALFMALSDKAKHKQIFLLDTLAIDGKTKKAAEALKALKLQEKNNTQPLLLAWTAEEKNAARAFRNISRVSVLSLHSLNAHEVARKRYVLMSVKGVEALEHQLT